MSDDNSRCAEKACPWPAATGHSICVEHLREELSPSAFCSTQPSGTLAAYALQVNYEKKD